MTPADIDGRLTYDGDDLGASYTPEATQFRVWAPSADAVDLVLWRDGVQTIPMLADRGGTWLLRIEGDLHGTRYRVRAEVEGVWREALDPYARASTVNAGHSVVVDLRRTDPERWTPARPDFSGELVDAVFYELHVRDLSIDPASGIGEAHRGRFLALTDHGTLTTSGNRSGIDPIRELGVTHVQLMPVYDFGSVDEQDALAYNWGYDPVQYNVPEGSYATDPSDPLCRIREFKQAVQSLHDDGLRVVMDVVYNHVFDAGTHAFEQLVPGYWFRRNPDGTLANATACGNEVASERAMVRRYIVDSVTYWAREYHIDGFRFDLMGILDIETMRAVRAALDAIDPSIVMIGEGWQMADVLPEAQRADQPNAALLPRIGQFNDLMRDGVKGSVWDHGARGWIQGETAARPAVLDGIVGVVRFGEAIGGNWGEIEPGQAVNYVEAHDNLTLYDKLHASLPDAGDAELARLSRLATSIVLLSQGVPFLHAGQEFLRTKHGDDNSYRSGDDVNALRWERRITWFELAEYVRGLIALRRAHPAFRMRDADAVRRNLRFLDTAPEVIAYTLDGVACRDTWTEIVVVHNAARHAQQVALPTRSPWGVAVDDWRAGFIVPMREPVASVEVAEQSTMVLYR